MSFFKSIVKSNREGSPELDLKPSLRADEIHDRSDIVELMHSDVVLACRAKTKKEVLSLIASYMVKNNYTKHNVLSSIVRQESELSSYVGNGIALPHLSAVDEHEIKNTGIIAVRIPNGIEWGGDIVNVVFGLACKKGNQPKILNQLTKVLLDQASLDIVKNSDNIDDVLSVFNAKLNFYDLPLRSLDVRRDVVVTNLDGISTRLAILIANIIKRHPDSKVHLFFKNRKIDAKRKENTKT